MPGGVAVKIASIGNEGVANHFGFLGLDASPTRLLVQGERLRTSGAGWLAVRRRTRRMTLSPLAGFAFAAEATRAVHWSVFGDGALVVPELLYRCDAGRARVTLDVIVQAGQPADSVCFAWRRCLTSLRTTRSNRVQHAPRAGSPPTR